MDEVRESLPQLAFPRSCSETLAYNLSIQALENDRYLTPVDYELFAQAWFQSARWYAHSQNIECDKRLPIGPFTGEQQMFPRPARQIPTGRQSHARQLHVVSLLLLCGFSFSQGSRAGGFFHPTSV